jgi:hypothetical protein
MSFKMGDRLVAQEDGWLINDKNGKATQINKGSEFIVRFTRSAYIDDWISLLREEDGAVFNVGEPKFYKMFCHKNHPKELRS